ncbi:hypothetical protein LWI28_023679 [Acer negundo]|uniref:Uncharacterized protein n=1 Tax=Acer negundo TaxID=4023 RepID=A0AAD5NJN3_ACENE|nr:hypothetical protein LWI28_023679 [Acer negundo]
MRGFGDSGSDNDRGARRRRNGRNIVGLHLGGKKPGLMASMGKIGSDSKKGNGFHLHGAKISRKVMGNGRKVVTALGGINGWKIVHSTGMTLIKKKKVSFTANKYMSVVCTSKNHLIIPFKENLGGEHDGTIRKGNIKSKHVSVEIEEDLEDSDVLKILHKDMLDSVMNITNSFSPGIDDCNFVPGEGKIVSDVMGNGLGETPSPLMFSPFRPIAFQHAIENHLLAAHYRLSHNKPENFSSFLRFGL